MRESLVVRRIVNALLLTSSRLESIYHFHSSPCFPRVESVCAGSWGLGVPLEQLPPAGLGRV